MPRQAVRKKGSKKDPNAPKRPPTAFFLFSKDHRAVIKSNNPGAGVTDVAKLLGAAWQNLSDRERKRYYGIADKETVHRRKGSACLRGVRGRRSQRGGSTWFGNTAVAIWRCPDGGYGLSLFLYRRAC